MSAYQTKHSIWPGVSTNIFVIFGARCSSIPMTWSIFVAKRLRQVIIPPFGPRLYLHQIPTKSVPPNPSALC